MSVILGFERITGKWTPLRRFAGITVESALDAVKQGVVDVASYFSKLLYLLPFAPLSVEKVLTYSLIKASRGYIEKNPSLYEIHASEVPGFEPDEVDKVKAAFEFLHGLDIAELIPPDRIKLKPEVINAIVEPVAPYLATKVNLSRVDLSKSSYPYRVVSGISSLYVMHKSDRLPTSFTIMMGLLSPTAWVRRDGRVDRKTTIEQDEWEKARNNMSMLRPLRNKFDLEYFRTIGLLHENKIIVATYPSAIEVVGMFVDKVIAPTYERYHRLRRVAVRVRP
jgi:hypothetical protein